LKLNPQHRRTIAGLGAIANLIPMPQVNFRMGITNMIAHNQEGCGVSISGCGFGDTDVPEIESTASGVTE
jgi:hypothetical protein